MLLTRRWEFIKALRSKVTHRSRHSMDLFSAIKEQQIDNIWRNVWILESHDVRVNILQMYAFFVCPEAMVQDTSWLKRKKMLFSAFFKGQTWCFIKVTHVSLWCTPAVLNCSVNYMLQNEKAVLDAFRGRCPASVSS